MVAAHPHLDAIDEVADNGWTPVAPGACSGDFAPAFSDHYLTNPIARASALMAELSANAAARRKPAIAAE